MNKSVLLTIKHYENCKDIENKSIYLKLIKEKIQDFLVKHWK